MPAERGAGEIASSSKAPPAAAAGPPADRSDPSVAEAIALLEPLRGVPPQHASSETVATYGRAAALLSSSGGSPLWFEAQTGLASHLLESPEGDRLQNVQAAERVYRGMLEHLAADRTPREWIAALSGLANALALNPAPSIATFAEASELYEGLATLLRQGGDSEDLAVVLGNAARMYSKAPTGDVDAYLNYAITLQEEALDVLRRIADPAFAALIARAQHNLGVLYLQRRTGARSQNVDRALRAFHAALEGRPESQDPVGRVRTLRALAIAYPEWSGAASLDEAQELAAEAAAEAARIDDTYEVARQRTSGRAEFERQRTALSVDLGGLYQLPDADRLPWLNGDIERHRNALRVIPRETMPALWAEWMGGLGRLLGRLPSLGILDQIDAAYDCFHQALRNIDVDVHPRLWRELLQRWGELCHGIGDFEGSLRAYGTAADLSGDLFGAFADPEHQWAELERTRGYALFAAYAAARLGEPQEAARLAELQRTQSMTDLLAAARALTGAPEERRQPIRDAVMRIRQLEDALTELQKNDPNAELERMRAVLADYAGADPSILQARRTDSAAEAPSPIGAERDRLGVELAEARRSLREVLAAGGSTEGPFSREFGAEDLAAVARAEGRALVYLMATVHGAMAVAVLSDGSFRTVGVDALTSDVTSGLLYGSAQCPSFAAAAMLRNHDQLGGSLSAIRGVLGPELLAPLESWLREMQVDRAVLIPLGSLGQLPLHVAAEGAIAFSYVPSGRALGLAANRARQRIGDGGALVIADPSRDDEPPLPFTVVEARAIAAMLRARGVAVRTCVGAEATLAQVRDGVAGASCIHLACHGQFRPSAPLASHLRLAGGDELTLADIMSARVELSAARLVVLSACQSGNIEFRRAPDESLGFPAALLLAGVPGVVSTMWPVDDAASMLFTCRLYELVLDGVDPAAAVAQGRAWLRELTAGELQQRLARLRATLEPGDEGAESALSDLWRGLVVADPSSKPYEAPEYWGAFTLTGL